MRFTTRLTLTAAVAVSVGLLFALLGAYLLTARTLVGTIDRSLETLAAELTDARHAPPHRPGLMHGPTSAGSVLRREGAFVQVIDAGGSVLGRTAGDEGFEPTPAARAVASGERPADRATVDIEGTPVRVLTVPARDGVALQLARPLREVDRTLARLRRRLALSGVVGVGLALALGAAAARRATRPVRDLTALAEEVTATGDLSRRIEPGGDDELARLARTIDRMLASVEEARVSQEQLVADASHELRTPLASLRTNAEILAVAERLSPDDRRDLVADVVGQLDEVTALVDDLVELARGARPAAPGAEAVPVDEAARRAVERLRGVAGERPLILDLDPVSVRGDAARLERVVTNLVVNALRHGAGPVTVAVEADHGAACLTVRDHGPGFLDADLPRVFDRFYRSEQARGAPGSGLGLAIVRQTVEAHGGEVTAANAEGGGAEVRVHLPAVEATAAP